MSAPQNLAASRFFFSGLAVQVLIVVDDVPQEGKLLSTGRF